MKRSESMKKRDRAARNRATGVESDVRERQCEHSIQPQGILLMDMTGNHEIDFETGDVPALFRKLFFPTLLGMLSVSAVTTIDGIFVGHGVGGDGIAAVNICIPLLMILTGVGLMGGMGASVIAAIHLAKGRRRMTRATITHALLAATLVTVATTALILIFPKPIAHMLGAADHLLPMAVDYLTWFAPSLIFELWIAISMFALRLDGAPNLAMWCSIVAAAANVVLDWLFIFPFDWGVMGAALATTLSTMAGAGVALVYLLFHARDVRLARPMLSAKGIRFFFRSVGLQCRIGSSAMLGEATMAVLMFVGNHVFMRFLGDDGVGAFGVACYYLPFVFMVGNAVAQSAQPIVSCNFGIGAWTRVRAALRVSMEAALLCGAISAIAFVALPKPLVGLFLSLESPAASIATGGFPWMGVGFVFFVANLAVIGLCQSVERVRPATIFALARGCVFLIPCFLILPAALGTKGIWLALPCSEILTSAAILVWLLCMRGKRPAAGQ